MKIQYLGHSCFRLSSGGYALVVDPYENDSVPGLKNLDTTANVRVFSHEHGDHHGENGVFMEESFLPCPFRIETIDSWHDDRDGSLRGRNRIHIFHVEKMKVVHLGDMGCAPLKWQMDLLKGADLVMAPAGGYYTAEPSDVCAVVREIGPRVVVPMHYRTAKSGFPVLKTCEEFLSCCGHVVRYETDTLTLDSATPPHTAVLKQWGYMEAVR